jgi:DNA gyrase subunit A
VDERELDVRRARDRLDILSGLLQSLDRRVEIDLLIWDASDADEARRRLTSEPFSFSEAQAYHILDMQLRRRTVADRTRLEDEAAELRAMLGD